jgi:hypothetical protein
MKIFIKPHGESLLRKRWLMSDWLYCMMIERKLRTGGLRFY